MGYHGWDGHTGATSTRSTACSSTFLRTRPMRFHGGVRIGFLPPPVLKKGICGFRQGIWSPAEKNVGAGRIGGTQTDRCCGPENASRFSERSRDSASSLINPSLPVTLCLLWCFLLPEDIVQRSGFLSPGTTSKGLMPGLLPGRRLSCPGCLCMPLLFDCLLAVGHGASYDWLLVSRAVDTSLWSILQNKGPRGIA